MGFAIYTRAGVYSSVIWPLGKEKVASQRSVKTASAIPLEPATILDSMLPTHRLGLGFDQIYLNHYTLAIE